MTASTKRSAVWDLLRSREGEWVTRAEIDFVGGAEGTRRLRELRQSIHKAGFTLDVQVHPITRESRYRLRVVEDDDPNATLYECANCGLRQRANHLTRSMDERYRIGDCPACGEKRAVWKAVA